MHAQEKLRFPVGRLRLPQEASNQQIDAWIATLNLFPQEVENRIAPLSSRELHSWTYRPGGWPMAQVVHHCADTHMQSYSRFKIS
ncbi:MAG: metal-dependent hydrolase, partial [Bacteroidota bacterium]